MQRDSTYPFHLFHLGRSHQLCVITWQRHRGNHYCDTREHTPAEELIQSDCAQDELGWDKNHYNRRYLAAKVKMRHRFNSQININVCPSSSAARSDVMRLFILPRKFTSSFAVEPSEVDFLTPSSTAVTVTVLALDFPLLREVDVVDAASVAGGLLPSASSGVSSPPNSSPSLKTIGVWEPVLVAGVVDLLVGGDEDSVLTLLLRA